MNPNWTRWIHASICKAFVDYAKNKFSLYIEGQDRKTAGLEDYAELRWDGPFANESSKGRWIIDIVLDSLVSSILSRDDAYQHKRIVGLVQAGFTDVINVYKYGNGPDDNSSELLGCLQLRSDNREGIVTSYFGQIDVAVLLEQSSVQATYRMLLSTR